VALIGSRLGALALALSSVLASVPAAAAESKCKLAQLAELPVTMVNARPTVPVKINGHEAPFFLDSGAMFGTLNPAWTARLGVKALVAPGYRVGGLGGSQDLFTGKVDEFLIGSVPLHHIDFIVAKGLESGVAGVVGQNLLGVFDTEYDLANGVVRLFKPDNCGDSDLAYWAKGAASMLPIERTDRAKREIIAPAYVNGQRIRAKWDTGAGRSLIAERSAARAGVTPKSEGAVFSGRIGGFGPEVHDSWIAPFDSFAVGGEKIMHTRLRFVDAEIGEHDMLLGLDFFLSHRVYVANSQDKVYFTYNGGPVFRLDIAQVADQNRQERAAQEQAAVALPAGPGEPVPTADAVGAAAETPKDAAGYVRRASAFRARLNYPAAIDDLTKAIALEPDNPQHYLQRAQVFGLSGQPVRAMGDYDEVLRRDSDSIPALMGRGSLYAGSRDASRARADLAAAARLGAADPTVALSVGSVYNAAGFYDDALVTFDAWLTAHPKAPRPDQDRDGARQAAAALNGRCWARAVLKKDLDQALADCDAALKLEPKAPGILNSRGLAHFERGEFDLAITDYNAALAEQPKVAMTLYARGVAKERKGLKEDGESDIKSAVALNARVADLARRYGLTP
jgi:tetratricopeptide (TPR) repeat protein